MLAPKAFKVKDKEPEQLLIDFDAYMKTVKNFFIATAKDGAADRTKLAILQAIGGPDMVDLVEIVGKVQLEAVVADAPNGVVGVAADTYQQAIEKIRQGIVARTNQAMSRLKLFQQMAQGEQQFSSWAQEVLKQAKMCTWQGYGTKTYTNSVLNILRNADIIPADCPPCPQFQYQQRNARNGASRPCFNWIQDKDIRNQDSYSVPTQNRFSNVFNRLSGNF